MKKIIAPFSLFLAITLSSCTMTYLQVTDNPIGNKTGEASGTSFSKDLDYTFSTAAKKGRITRIGSAEFKITMIGPYVKYQTTVTGE